jgi:hypothetical protein
MENSLLLTEYNFTMKIKGLLFRYFLGKPDGKRKAGRPKLKELDYTENDVKSRDVKRCTKKAEDRSAWLLCPAGVKDA